MKHEPSKLPNEGSWSGRPAFVIGGGPSLRDFNWQVLREPRGLFRTIAVNAAFLHVPTADLFFTKDYRLLRKYEENLEFKQFPGLKICSLVDSKPRIQEQIIMVPRSKKGLPWASKWADGLPGLSNSGAVAVNVACILGADPVYLLGFDFKIGVQQSNYHDEYPPEWRPSDDTMELYRLEFDAFVSQAGRDRHIINVINPQFDSALQSFQRMFLEDFYRLPYFRRVEDVTQS